MEATYTSTERGMDKEDVVQWNTKKICTMKYYSAMKKKEIMPSAVSWMDLEIVILSEISTSVCFTYTSWHCQPSYVLAPNPDPASHCTFIFNTFLKFIWLIVAVAHRIFFLVVAGSLVVAFWFPDQGWNPGPLHWEHRVWATGHQGSSSNFRSEHLHCKIVVRGVLLCWFPDN